MKKLHYIAMALLVLIIPQQTISMEKLPELTLVVGNVRAAGGGDKSAMDLVKQDMGDFTHSKSFKGRVVSVDICPRRSQQKYEHIQLDFVNTSSETIISDLKGVRPTRIFFEWFPSWTGKGNIAPLLFPAIKRAFEILAPGGELLIDHHPYVLALPTAYREAYGKIKKDAEVSLSYVSKATAKLDVHKPGLVERLQEPGVLSRLLQESDPFSLNICREEHDQIRNYLMFRWHNPDTIYDDSKFQFIKGKTPIIDEIISLLPNPSGYTRQELIALVSNGLKNSYLKEKPETQGYWHLFEWGYYMKTRGSLVLATLRDIGFSVDDGNAIQFNPVNPYNQRLFAWLISAKKPTTESHVEATGKYS